MEDKIVTFETAQLAKEKGFPQLELGMKEYCPHTKELTVKPFGYNIKAPTQTTLQTWLREIHNTEVNPQHEVNGMYNIWTNRGNLMTPYMEFASYEEAMEFGLKTALENIS